MNWSKILFDGGTGGDVCNNFTTTVGAGVSTDAACKDVLTADNDVLVIDAELTEKGAAVADNDVLVIDAELTEKGAAVVCNDFTTAAGTITSDGAGTGTVAITGAAVSAAAVAAAFAAAFAAGSAAVSAAAFAAVSAAASAASAAFAAVSAAAFILAAMFAACRNVLTADNDVSVTDVEITENGTGTGTVFTVAKGEGDELRTGIDVFTVAKGEGLIIGIDVFTKAKGEGLETGINESPLFLLISEDKVIILYITKETNFPFFQRKKFIIIFD